MTGSVDHHLPEDIRLAHLPFRQRGEPAAARAADRAGARCGAFGHPTRPRTHRRRGLARLRRAAARTVHTAGPNPRLPHQHSRTRDGPAVSYRYRRPRRTCRDSPGTHEFRTHPLPRRGRDQLVIDQYGGFAGVLTIKDIAEELVGDIADEHDPESRQDRGSGRRLVDRRRSAPGRGEATAGSGTAARRLRDPRRFGDHPLRGASSGRRHRRDRSRTRWRGTDLAPPPSPTPTCRSV